MAFTHATFEVEDKVATLTLNRPEARNALSPEMRRDIDAAIERVKDEAGTTIKALIITGAGGSFCAGGDVKAMHARSSLGDGKPAAGNAPSAHAGRAGMRAAHTRLIELMNLEVPVICAVDGAAAGGGCNFALAGDFVLASERAVFIQSFVKIGLVPDWNGLFILPRLVGLQKAKELMFTGRKVRAAEAKELGMVHSVHKPEDLMPAARKMAGKFTRASTAAIGMMKNLLNQSFHLDPKTMLEFEALAQGTARLEPYHAEAVARFSRKEPALFDWDAED